ncbi:Leu/Ile/Val-binding protein precursor [compost metagenome]
MFKPTKIHLALVACTAMTLSQLAAADVVIGVAGPMTGLAAAFGDQMWRGAEQAAIDINAKGGINGEKIRLIKADDACEPKQAVAVANRLVNADKVNAVVGHFCSSSTVPASEVYDEAGVISMTPGSTNPKITDRGLSYIFRMCGRDDQQGVIAGDFIVDTLHAKKVAIIHDKDTYGQGLADATMAEIRKRGLSEVLYEGITRGEKDFNALVTKIRSTGADVVYFGGIHPEAGPIIRQLREQGLTTTFVSGDALATAEMVSTAGGAKYVNGMYMTFGSDPRLSPDGKQVIENFRAHGYEPEGFTLYSYSAVQALAAAFNAVGSLDNDKASKWLKENPVHTVMGVKEFDNKGDLKKSDYIMYQWGADGTYKQL